MTAPNHHKLYDAVQQSAKTQPVTLHYWERRSRPRLPAPSFPGSQGRREALHWGQEPWPRRGIWGKCGLTPHLAGAPRPPNVPLASGAMARYDYWEKE